MQLISNEICMKKSFMGFNPFLSSIMKTKVSVWFLITLALCSMYFEGSSHVPPFLPIVVGANNHCVIEDIGIGFLKFF